MKLSVVIPAYNEKENLKELTRRFFNVFEKQGITFEIVYVIQGQDGSMEMLRDMGDKRLKMIYFKEPIGVGRAFRSGFQNISEWATHVLTMDADLNHSPEEFPRFIKKMEETNADIIVGSRRIGGGDIKKEADAMYSKWKQGVSYLTNMLLVILDMKVKDLTSGYRLFKKNVILNIRGYIKAKDFEVYPEILLLAKKKGYSIVEVPITFRARVHGKSKLNFLTSGIGYLKFLMRTFFRF